MMVGATVALIFVIIIIMILSDLAAIVFED